MAKSKGQRTGGDGGAKVPSESCELGEIVTAAKSTMEAHSFERGYSEPENYLHMRQLGGGGKK